ncbi:Activin receptor type-1C [Anabarilius grahami]|uniref:Activin receptor type-1C n=1 Tax=Anabarilius grahami TaxID=495550 RepID=A0A3N0XGQ0_ANAGA|nr:Activin receptor type-1C [Anabarilius grahami]
MCALQNLRCTHIKAHKQDPEEPLDDQTLVSSDKCLKELIYDMSTSGSGSGPKKPSEPCLPGLPRESNLSGLLRSRGRHLFLPEHASLAPLSSSLPSMMGYLEVYLCPQNAATWRNHSSQSFTPKLYRLTLTDGCSVKSSSSVRNLGVLFDTNLSFESHVSSIYKTAFFHFKNISKLSELLMHYSPSGLLRSQNSGQLIIPRISKSTAGGRSFSYLAPKLWNSLPITVLEADTLCQFKSKLKTHLFKLAYT